MSVLLQGTSQMMKRRRGKLAYDGAVTTRQVQIQKSNDNNNLLMPPHRLVAIMV